MRGSYPFARIGMRDRAGVVPWWVRSPHEEFGPTCAQSGPESPVAQRMSQVPLVVSDQYAWRGSIIRSDDTKPHVRGPQLELPTPTSQVPGSNPYLNAWRGSTIRRGHSISHSLRSSASVTASSTEQKKVPTSLLGLTCSGRAIMFGPFSFVTFLQVW